MSIENLKERLPDYAKDLRLSLSAMVNPEHLSGRQMWGTMLASAVASRNEEVTTAIAAEASEHLDDAALRAAKGAAALMSMTNVYYRFVHLASNKAYERLPARLRMNLMANPGVDKTDFELWELAVSAVNGCGACIDGHEKHLIQQGVAPEVIHEAVRIASVVHAVAVALEAERHLAPVG
jgi:alkyl hydroperoxide reductase subunit D